MTLGKSPSLESEQAHLPGSLRLMRACCCFSLTALCPGGQLPHGP